MGGGGGHAGPGIDVGGPCKWMIAEGSHVVLCTNICEGLAGHVQGGALKVTPHVDHCHFRAYFHAYVPFKLHNEYFMKYRVDLRRKYEQSRTRTCRGNDKQRHAVSEIGSGNVVQILIRPLLAHE